MTIPTTPTVSTAPETAIPTLAEFEDAAAALRPVILQTPFDESEYLSDVLGAPVHLKLENLQRTGSFKIRGATYRLSRLSAEERARGVVAASAGNHAQGVALAAQKLGISATIFMPIGVPVPKLLATDAFFVFLMVQFIRGLPTELDEAARIDGCGHFSIFTKILLPLMVPALATTTIFTFIWMWNDFLSSLIYLTSPETYTVPLALRSFLDSSGQSNWGAMFAMSVVSLIPVFLAFLFGQRFLIRGIATTGIK